MRPGGCFRLSVAMAAAAFLAGSQAAAGPDESATVAGRQEAVQFTVGPKAVTADGQVKITFAVSAPTDVEVAVLDARGEVVRHLAAGALSGAAPPPAPLKPGLSQTLVWDGNDDSGRSVFPPSRLQAERRGEGRGLSPLTPALSRQGERGTFKVRVRLGLRVELDGFIGENKHHFGGFWGMATDPEGKVYIFGSSTGNRSPQGTQYIQVLGRDGRYVRTIMPMPANLPPDSLKAFDVVVTEDGFVTPRNYSGTWPVFYRGVGGGLEGEQGGSTASRIGADGIIWMTDGQHVARLSTDGSGVGKQFSRYIWAQQPHRTIAVWLTSWQSDIAVSPDNKHLYVAGLFQREPFQKQLLFPRGRIYRAEAALSLSKGGHLTPFVDLTGTDGPSTTLGAALSLSKGGKPDPVGHLVCDTDGNLLVCAGERIVVLNPAGKQVGELAVPSPERVAIHRQTGAVYVLSAKQTGHYISTKHLIKFSGWGKEARELARIGLRDAGRGTVMALDDSADPPVIWVGINRSKAGDAWKLDSPAQVLRLEDRSGEFVITDHECRFAHLPMGVVTRLAVHPETDLVIARGEYAHTAGYEGLTGKPVKLPFSHCVDMGVGRDGKWYIQTGYGWAGPLCRFDKDLTPLPAPTRVSTDERQPAGVVVPRIFGRWGQGFGTMGVTADGKGRIVNMQQLDEHTVSGDCITAFGPDGAADDPGRLRDNQAVKSQDLFSSVLVGPIDGKCGGIAVDREGYIYFGFQGLPEWHKPPRGFEKDPAYNAVVGTVIKMKPEGGSVFDIGGPDARPPRKSRPIPEGITGFKLTRRAGYPCGTAFVENGVQAYPGLGSVSGNFGHGCRCRQPIFQVDPWGRLFVPNAITCSVKVLDNEGNEITTFGHYGNADSRGDRDGSAIPTPTIPLGWPEAVGVSRKNVYVADVLNRRIVRVMKKYSASSVCQVEE